MGGADSSPHLFSPPSSTATAGVGGVTVASKALATLKTAIETGFPEKLVG